MSQYQYFALMGLIQLAHSQEEIWTGFHKRWFVFTMPRSVFISFEVLFSLAIIVYIAKPNLPYAHAVMPAFNLLMMINGIGHIVWALVVKKYVPGLITAPFFVVTFGFYFLSLAN